MKKIMALLLTFMLLLSLTACGGSSASDHSTSAPQTDDDTASLQAQSSEVQQDSNDKEDDDKTEDKKEELLFTEMVAVDNDECMIKITGIDQDNLWGYTLKVQLENKSTEKTYMYSVERAAINGVQCDPLFATEVAAGKKANDDISFINSSLEENDVGEYTDIELSFRVYDSNDWMADEVAKETVHVYPYGEEKATRFVREAQSTDNVIVDNEYVTVIVTGYEQDDIWGYSVNLFLLNKTDKNVMFTVDEASVNGYMADPFFAITVSAGKCAFNAISWFDTTLEENDITQVEEIEFKLRVYDADNWLEDDLANETIVLNP